MNQPRDGHGLRGFFQWASSLSGVNTRLLICRTTVASSPVYDCTAQLSGYGKVVCLGIGIRLDMQI